MDFSIVIPVKDEAVNIGPLVADIERVCQPLEREYEIVFVDDGSTDDTCQVVRELRNRCPFIRLVRFDRNYGKTAALRAGFEHSSGEIIVIMDGDRQNDPCDIPRFIDKIASFNIVVGYREKRFDNWFRLAQSRFANRVRRAITRDGVFDSGCGYQALRRECLKKIELFSGMHRFLPCLFKMHGFSIAQIPVKHHPRLAGKSKYPFWSRTVQAFHDLLAIRWMLKRTIEYRIKNEL